MCLGSSGDYKKEMKVQVSFLDEDSIKTLEKELGPSGKILVSGIQKFILPDIHLERVLSQRSFAVNRSYKSRGLGLILTVV